MSINIDNNKKLKKILDNFKKKLNSDNNNYQILKNINKKKFLNITCIFIQNNEIMNLLNIKKNYTNEQLDNIINNIIYENNYLINYSLIKIFFFKFLININNIDLLLNFNNNIEYNTLFHIFFINFYVNNNKIILLNNISDKIINDSNNNLFFIEDLNSLYLIFEYTNNNTNNNKITNLNNDTNNNTNNNKKYSRKYNKKYTKNNTKKIK